MESAFPSSHCSYSEGNENSVHITQLHLRSGKTRVEGIVISAHSQLSRGNRSRKLKTSGKRAHPLQSPALGRSACGISKSHQTISACNCGQSKILSRSS